MQLTTKIDFSKYKRFFAFGCSFTNYAWHTWADIIGAKFPGQYYNWGKVGGGNMFIACSVAEANARYRFNEDDLVMCMWSSVTREDRYKDNMWHTGGNIYNCKFGTKDLLRNWADPRFYLLRDLAQIGLTQNLLETTQCSWDFLSMISLTSFESDKVPSMKYADIQFVYQKELQTIKPSVGSVLYNDRWSNPAGINGDCHPSPLQHKKYLELTYPDTDFTFFNSELAKEEELWRSGVYNFNNRKVERPKFNRL